MPAGALALYVMDVAVSQDDAHDLKQISAGMDLRSVPPPWLPVALRYETLLGDTTAALDFARARASRRTSGARPPRLFEIAIAHSSSARREHGGVDQIMLAQADAESADPMRSPDPALALVAIEAHAWAGDVTSGCHAIPQNGEIRPTVLLHWRGSPAHAVRIKASVPIFANRPAFVARQLRRGVFTHGEISFLFLATARSNPSVMRVKMRRTQGEANVGRCASPSGLR